MKQYQPYLMLCIWLIAFAQFIFGIEYVNTNEFIGIITILCSAIAIGISTGLAIRILLIDKKEEAETAPQANSLTKRKVSRDNRLVDMLELMDDEERQIFMQALKDRYLNEKSKGLIDGELPFDDDVYEYDRQ